MSTPLISPTGEHASVLIALMAAVRPEFRSDVLVFAAEDPVFGGGACRVPGCRRHARGSGLCQGHRLRWQHTGRPDLDVFAATTDPRWARQRPNAACRVNAFVERFQGSVLHLHYRTAFRYRFYTSADDIDTDLQGWLRYYNFERPHRGYRTRGRIPAGIFYTARPDLLTAKGWNPDDIYPAA